MTHTYRYIGYFAMVVLLSCLFSAYYSSGRTTTRVQNFTQLKNGQVKLQFTPGYYRYQTQSAPTQPDHWPTLPASASYAFSNRHGEMTVQLADQYYDQPTLISLEHCRFWHFVCRPVGTLELLRQSERLLYQRYHFIRPDGYTVLGRTSLALPNQIDIKTTVRAESVPLTTTLPPIPLTARAKQIAPQDPSLQQAISLAEFIWTHQPKLGPHNNDAPNHQDPMTRLALLHAGQWSVQCGGIQAIFVNLAAYLPLIDGVRNVNLTQYYPTFPDLVPNSHATVGVYSQREKKWVFFDPWYGVMFSRHGHWLSAAEIQQYLRAGKQNEITVTHFLPQRPHPFVMKDVASSGVIVLENFYWGYWGTVSVGPDEHINASYALNH